MKKFFTDFIEKNDVLSGVSEHFVLGVYFITKIGHEEVIFADEYRQLYVFRFDNGGQLESMFVTRENYLEKIPKFTECERFESVSFL